MTVLKKSMLIMAVSLLAWAQVSFADTPNTIMTSETGEYIVSKVNDEQTQISFMYCNSNNECSNIGKESYEIELIEKQIDLEAVKIHTVLLVMPVGAAVGLVTAALGGPVVVATAGFTAFLSPALATGLGGLDSLPSSFNPIDAKHHFNVLNALNNSLARSGSEFGFSTDYLALLPAVVSDDKFQSFLDDLKEGLADTDLILRYDRLMLR